MVAVQVAPPEIVSYVKIGSTVGGGVSPGASETVAVVLGMQSCRLGLVDERGVSFVVHEEVGWTVARVKIGRRVVILVQAKIVAVEAEVDIETAVAIAVGQRCMRERSLGRSLELEGIALDQKRSVALIEEEQGAAAANHQQVLPPLVLKVGEQRTSGVVEHPHSRFFSDVFEAAIAPVAVEPVGQARRLANIEIIEAVIIEITHRDAIVAVNVNPA